MVRLSVVDRLETANAACGLIQFVTSRTLYQQFQITGSYVISVSGFAVCQAGNRMYLYRELDDVTGDFQDQDMIADFDRDVTQPWKISHIQDHDVFRYKLRRLYDRDVMFPHGKADYVFMTYLAETEQALEGLTGDEFVESPPSAFTSGIGFPFFVYGPLRGYYVNGQVTGDTTTVYTTSIDRDPIDELPALASLTSVYPNPFNPSTVIGYRLSGAHGGTPVRVFVVDLLGREVAVLFDGMQAPGAHTATFDATHLPSGAYVVVLRAGETTDRRMVTLVK